MKRKFKPRRVARQFIRNVTALGSVRDWKGFQQWQTFMNMMHDFGQNTCDIRQRGLVISNKTGCTLHNAISFRNTYVWTCCGSIIL